MLIFVFLQYTNASVIAVELDPVIVDVAKKYFGVVEDLTNDRFCIRIEDGAEFIKKGKNFFDCIWVDVAGGNSKQSEVGIGNGISGENSKQSEVGIGISGPSPVFIENEFLESAKSRLKNGGSFVMNIISRNSEETEKLLEKISSIFPFIFIYANEEEVNTVAFCFSESNFDFSALKKNFAKIFGFKEILRWVKIWKK